MRTLIAHASAAGSTGEVAATIGEVLRGTGAQVDVRPAGQVRDLDGYDGVDLGSAVRYGKVLPAAQRFIERERGRLGDQPVAYFAVCGDRQEDTPEHRRTALGYLVPLRRSKEPMGIGLFAGKVDDHAINLPLRLVLKAMKKPAGDWRDWAAIRSWASGAADALRAAPAGASDAPTRRPAGATDLAV